MIKPRAGNVARVGEMRNAYKILVGKSEGREMTNAYNILVGKSEGKRPLRRPRRR
jgi:hypothetical protein